MRHLTTDTLLNHIENTVDSADRIARTEHLGSCTSCQEKAEELQELVSFLSCDAANEPPADLVQWGVQLFQPVLRPKENPLRRLVGKLVFDSCSPRPPVFATWGRLPDSCSSRPATSTSISGSSRAWTTESRLPARSSPRRSRSLTTRPCGSSRMEWCGTRPAPTRLVNLFSTKCPRTRTICLWTCPKGR